MKSMPKFGCCSMFRLVSVFIVLKNSFSLVEGGVYGVRTSSCRQQLVAGYYSGYECSITETGIRSVPGNVTALRMVNSGKTLERHQQHLSLPSLPTLRILEYDVTRDSDVSEKPFVHLADLDKLQLFHAASRGDDFRFEIKSGIFDGLLNLSHLILSDLGIESLPFRAFDGLTKLRILELNHNRLSQLVNGTFFNCCQELKVLTLSGNRFSDIEGISWYGLSTLRTLDLNSNGFKVLKGYSFQGLNDVTNIDLTANKLVTIHSFAFTGLEKLKELFLNDNKLDFLHDDDSQNQNNSKMATMTTTMEEVQGIRRWSFWGLSSLETLEIKNNNITCIYQLFFQGLGSLRWLDLTGNYIQFLTEDYFRCMPRLSGIFLSGNQLRTLDRKFRSFFSRLSQIDISSNPWHCDCQLHWLTEWLSTSATKELGDLLNTNCETPFPDPVTLIDAYKILQEQCITTTVDKDPTAGVTATGATVAGATTTADLLPSLMRDQTMPYSRLLDDSSSKGPTRELTTMPNSIFCSENIQNSENTLSDAVTTPDNVQLETLDSLLRSVTENMKNLDSLLITTAANIKTLNRLLTETFDKVDNEEPKNPPHTATPKMYYDSSQQRSNSSSSSSLHMTIAAVHPLFIFFAALITFLRFVHRPSS